MSEPSGDRPQDAGRRHRRRGNPSPETAALLTAYQSAMRDELRAVLAELRGTPEPAGLMPDVVPALKRPSLADRMRLWDLAIKLGRELGTAIDAAPPEADGPAPAPRARRRVDYG